MFAFQEKFLNSNKSSSKSKICRLASRTAGFRGADKKWQSKNRPFDKENLLEQIQKQQQRQLLNLHENQVLREELNRKKDIKRNWSENQIKLIIESLKNENEELQKKVQEKCQEIQTMKRKQQFTNFLEADHYYKHCKEQLIRLRNIIKKDRKERKQLRKQKNNRKLVLNVQSQERMVELEQKVNDNADLEEDLKEMKSQLKEITGKLISKERNKVKLMEEVQLLEENLGSLRSDQFMWKRKGKEHRKCESIEDKVAKNQLYGVCFNKSITCKNFSNQNLQTLPQVPQMVDSQLQQSMVGNETENKNKEEYDDNFQEISNETENYGQTDSDQTEYLDDNLSFQ